MKLQVEVPVIITIEDTEINSEEEFVDKADELEEAFSDFLSDCVYMGGVRKKLPFDEACADLVNAQILSDYEESPN